MAGLQYARAVPGSQLRFPGPGNRCPNFPAREVDIGPTADRVLLLEASTRDKSAIAIRDPSGRAIEAEALRFSLGPDPTRIESRLS